MAATPRPLFDPQIVRRATRDSFIKLAPRHMVRNPVMFVVLIGSVLTTLVLLRDAAGGRGHLGFTLQIALWLWFTVLFANFAEAMAEGRGKAQAEELKKTRSTTMARKWLGGGKTESVPGSQLRAGDLEMVTAGGNVSRGRAV